jgi:glutamate 5-kinase
MATKIAAAKISTEKKIPCVVMSGGDPEDLYHLLDGEPLGTVFYEEGAAE